MCRLGAEYRRDVRDRLERLPATGPVLTEADLEPLPEPVRRYIRLAGAIDRPGARHFRAVWQGRIRATADEPWMPFTAEQHNFPGEPARFFHMKARRSGLPVAVYHAFSNGSASMRVRLLGLFALVDRRGPDLDRAEAVTLLNDLCVMAPGALCDAAIEWDPVDDRSARARYTVGPNTVSATLHFDEAGELRDFVSDDRLIASPDGRELTPCRWSTPLADYREFGPHRAAARGEGRWHPPEGEFVYLELDLLELDHDGDG